MNLYPREAAGAQSLATTQSPGGGSSGKPNRAGGRAGGGGGRFWNAQQDQRVEEMGSSGLGVRTPAPGGSRPHRAVWKSSGLPARVSEQSQVVSWDTRQAASGGTLRFLGFLESLERVVGCVLCWGPGNAEEAEAVVDQLSGLRA